MAFQFPTGPMATTGEFSADTRGILAAGTETSKGVIVGRSYTAYEMADGAFVPFDSIHARAAMVEPLVVFA